jgi:hypothetical protein
VDALEFWKSLAIIVAGVVALTTFLTGIAEYVRRGRHERAENFLNMRRRFLESGLFREILNALATEDPRVASIPIQDRRNFLAFFEEVELLVRSRLIRREVAFYMFGYYVLLAERSDALWTGIDRKDRYWRLFREFAAGLRSFETRAEVPSRDLTV